MEKENVFKNAGGLWSNEEDNQLNKLYNEDMLSIMEISKIHNRAPGGIISRLRKHNYIPNRKFARGYSEYINSDLYKEIVANRKEERKQTKDKVIKSKAIDNILININKKYFELHNDIKQMKNEIVELKTTTKELVEMMKAIYEFEDA
jgi:hypothetical protein